ncbi:hypothetical protein WAJ08_20920, partial [Acinetobacter baumannii]
EERGSPFGEEVLGRLAALVEAVERAGIAEDAPVLAEEVLRGRLAELGRETSLREGALAAAVGRRGARIRSLRRSGEERGGPRPRLHQIIRA